jgi:hypothetical protein
MSDLSLWDRFQGFGSESQDPEDAQIPAHKFWAMVAEWDRGYLTQAEVIAEFDLAQGLQIAEGARLKQLMSAAPDKVRFRQVAKDWSYIAENGSKVAKYASFTALDERLVAEIEDQGGVAP